MPLRRGGTRAVLPRDIKGDPTRRAIFERLVGRPSSVRELADVLPVSCPAVSQHLEVLTVSGLLVDRAEGTRRIYRVDLNRIDLQSGWGFVLERFASHAAA
jgi:DNA-binding transcriptional ArsR family regulator